MLPRLIPREVLFGNPTFAMPRLSPDGQWISYIAPLDGVLNVWLRPAVGGEARAITHDTGRGIRFQAWAEDGRHLLYIQDRDGDENWHVYAVDIVSEEVRDLTPFPGVQAQVTAVERNVPDTILVSINKRDPGLHDVYSIRVADGESEMIAENPGDVMGWIADADLQIRAAASPTPEGGWAIRVRSSTTDEWRTAYETGPEDEASPSVFTEDGSSLYLVSSKGYNTKRVLLMDVASGDVTAIAGRDDVDAGGSIFHPTTRALQAVSFERHRQEWVILDADIQPDFDALRKVADGDIDIVSRSDDDSVWIVAFSRDIGSTVYYTYERAASKAAFLFSSRPALDEYTLAPMESIDVTSRDGLVVPCYLTVPAGLEAKGLPLVLNVHGGPWLRDTWGYDAEAQWFANRGYACLQVNYRGSDGYGKSYLHAGDQQWGGTMLNDLIDAVNWAVDEGIADPEKLAIYGGSYGGYATLCGVTFTPDVFCCGVDIVGVSNLLTFLNSIPPYWEPMRKLLDERVGNAEKDEAMLKERSPFFHAERITAPLLIAQGANDPRVKQAESEQIVDTMRKSGKDVEYMLFPDEGHGFARPENRLKFYAAAEEFLAKYLGGRTEA